MPARALNSVVLPVFGLPTRATVQCEAAVMVRSPSRVPARPSAPRTLKRLAVGHQLFDGNAGGFAATEAKAVVAQEDFHGIAERRETDHLDLFALQQPHFEKTLDQAVF